MSVRVAISDVAVPLLISLSIPLDHLTIHGHLTRLHKNKCERSNEFIYWIVRSLANKSYSKTWMISFLICLRILMLCWFTNVTDNTFTFYQSVAASNCFLGYLQFWKSFPSCPRFRSAEVKMAGGIISTDLAVTKMGARGRISRELTNLLKEPPLGCFANLKVFYPKRNVSEKWEALLTLLGFGGVNAKLSP